jgi:hypothetical protein
VAAPPAPAPQHCRKAWFSEIKKPKNETHNF